MGPFLGISEFGPIRAAPNRQARSELDRKPTSNIGSRSPGLLAYPMRCIAASWGVAVRGRCSGRTR